MTGFLFFFFSPPPVLPPPPRSEASLPRLHPSVLKADEPSLRPNAGQFPRPPLGPRGCHSRSFRSTRSAEDSSQNQFCRRLRNKLSLFSFFFYPPTTSPCTSSVVTQLPSPASSGSRRSTFTQQLTLQTKVAYWIVSAPPTPSVKQRSCVY